MPDTANNPSSSEKRKKEQLRLSLSKDAKARRGNGLERVRIRHEALPEMNLEEVSLQVFSLGRRRRTPFYISSMTGGWKGALALNLRLARAAERRGWAMGAGSQRSFLESASAGGEWRRIRQAAPQIELWGNLGLTEAVSARKSDFERLMRALKAQAMIIHCNPLQEALQKEGRAHFKGGLPALKKLAKTLKKPLVVKETGCGFSSKTLDRLTGWGLGAVDIAGLGGAHWGRIEGLRHTKGSVLYGSGEVFAEWGISTLESLLNARRKKRDFEVWASGGLNSGLDCAKVLALGARRVGFGRLILQSAVQGEKALDQTMERLERELKISLFCSGCATIKDLQKNGAASVDKSF